MCRRDYTCVVHHHSDDGSSHWFQGDVAFALSLGVKLHMDDFSILFMVSLFCSSLLVMDRGLVYVGHVVDKTCLVLGEVIQEGFLKVHCSEEEIEEDERLVAFVIDDLVCSLLPPLEVQNHDYGGEIPILVLIKTSVCMVCDEVEGFSYFFDGWKVENTWQLLDDWSQQVCKDLDDVFAGVAVCATTIYDLLLGLDPRKWLTRPGSNVRTDMSSVMIKMRIQANSMAHKSQRIHTNFVNICVTGSVKINCSYGNWIVLVPMRKYVLLMGCCVVMQRGQNTRFVWVIELGLFWLENIIMNFWRIPIGVKANTMLFQLQLKMRTCYQNDFQIVDLMIVFHKRSMCCAYYLLGGSCNLMWKDLIYPWPSAGKYLEIDLVWYQVRKAGPSIAAGLVKALFMLGSTNEIRNKLCAFCMPIGLYKPHDLHKVVAVKFEVTPIQGDNVSTMSEKTHGLGLSCWCLGQMLGVSCSLSCQEEVCCWTAFASLHGSLLLLITMGFVRHVPSLNFRIV